MRTFWPGFIGCMKKLVAFFTDYFFKGHVKEFLEGTVDFYYVKISVVN